jgi:hypothetical protein
LLDEWLFFRGVLQGIAGYFFLLFSGRGAGESIKRRFVR